MAEEIVLQVKHLAKEYKLYDKKSDRLREALSITKKTYCKPFRALDNISFEVRRGETVGVIGTNGSGKSTLLKILTGVVSPSGGMVQVNGKVSALLELGAGFNMEYTGLENIQLHGTMQGFSEEEMNRRRQEIIDFADIGDYINQPVKNYSSGMFARLAFAVAISIDPEILIVDEALSVGDVFFQSKCFRKFDELREKGVSILFVSHDTGAVRKMCSKVLWIERGVQQMFGPCNEVCTAYFNSQMQRMNEQNLRHLGELQVEQNEAIGEVDLATYPKLNITANSVLSDKVEILSSYVKNAQGAYVKRMVADETYTIGVVTKYHENMENVIVGFSMNNPKGIILLAGNTFADTGTNFSVKKGEVLETEFTFTAPRLRSGEYEISPAVALGIQESHVNLTWLHGVVSVEFDRPGYEISEVGAAYQVNNRNVKTFDLV